MWVGAGRKLVHRNSPHTTNQSIQCVPNRPKLQHTTPLTLDMLAQPTQRIEPLPAGAQGAEINLLLVPWAREMLVKGRKGLVFPMAEVALVCVAVPRSASRDVGGFRVARGASDKARRVGDDTVDVVLANEAVDGGTVDSRAAASRFEVEDQRRLRDESLSALVPRANDIPRFVNG